LEEKVSIQFSVYFLRLLVVIWIYHKVLSIFINQSCCVDLNSVPDNTTNESAEESY